MNWESTISALVGGLVGGGLVTLYNFCKNLQNERNRKKILLKLLNDKKYSWRSLETLSKVIGLDVDGTKSLLIAIGARGSLKEKDVWGLISRHPLNEDNIP